MSKPVGSIEVDRTRWPLIIITMLPGPLPHAALDEFFADQKAMLRRDLPFVQIADASRAEVLDARNRKKMSEFNHEVAAASARLCKGTAVVISSGVVRGAMTAVLWVLRPRYPLVVVGTFGEALEYCIGRLREESMPVAADIEALRVESMRGHA